MSSTITMNITQQQLESIIFNAVQDALSKSSVKAPRAPRKSSTTAPAPVSAPTKDAPISSSASVAGSEKSKRSLGQATQEHINLTEMLNGEDGLITSWKNANKERMASLKTDERFKKLFGVGFHLKVQSILKPKLEAGATLSNILVNEAIEYLISNPEYQSANAKKNASKPAKVAPAPSTAPSTTTQEPTTSEVAPKPKRGRPSTKKSAPSTETPAKEEAPKATKAKETKPKKVAPPPPSEPEADSEEEDEDVQMTQINIGGTDYLWNEEDGSVYEVAEGGLGEQIGTSTDGITIDYA